MFRHLYRFFLRNGLRGRGALTRVVARLHPEAERFPVAVDGIGNVCVDLTSNSVIPLLDSVFGDDQSALVRAMELFVRPGDILWDVGANVGTVSLYFARARFGLASIEAFEPNPSMAAHLRLMFDSIGRVRVNQVALGDRNKDAILNIPEDDSSTASLTTGRGTPTPISVVTGDRVAGKPPSVIKIDVEGYEPQVISGLQNVIAEAQPVIFFEHSFVSEEIISAFVPFGYSRFFILDGGELTIDLIPGDWSHDSVLVPAGRIAYLSSTAIRKALRSDGVAR